MTDCARPTRGRLALAAVVALCVFAAAVWLRPATPRLSGNGHGDRALCALVKAQNPVARDLTVVLVNGSAGTRTCTWAADAGRPYEIGSVSKAMTGMLIDDAVDRGEVSLDDRLGDYLALGSSGAASITLRQAVTHSSGLPRDIGAGLPGLFSFAVLGTNPYGMSTEALIQDAKGASLGKREFAYSNAGAALAGQAVAAAAGMPYAELMRDRLFSPLGMDSTSVQTTPAVPAGWSAAGIRMAPWAMTGYAPTGGIVSTAPDLTRFVSAVLDGTAPGIHALTPLGPADDGTRVGTLWLIGHPAGGDALADLEWHNGQTGGYASFVGVDPATHRGVVVLSDVASNVDALALRVLKDG